MKSQLGAVSGCVAEFIPTLDVDEGICYKHPENHPDEQIADELKILYRPISTILPLRCDRRSSGRQIYHFHKLMAESGNSMVYSLLLFVVTLSLQEMYRGKLASSELFTILGGFTSSLVFLFLLTFIGNYQETSGVKTGWGAVILAEAVALIAAGTVHRVCITTCFLFSAVILYEVTKISGVMVSKSEAKARRH
ncbi:hypothetical protein L1987_80602 [Smallanthus sonchifolius]|uniref:Uncharacterized protein n=1 Tax=Smallanthus sonchifolius TaxID=185202 RepID=A0ACB8YN27_9ASTR|nr:hypothetical protein L1987_80602 [Smallanthus sonchifolius]